MMVEELGIWLWLAMCWWMVRWFYLFGYFVQVGEYKIIFIQATNITQDHIHPKVHVQLVLTSCSLLVFVGVWSMDAPLFSFFLSDDPRVLSSFLLSVMKCETVYSCILAPLLSCSLWYCIGSSHYQLIWGFLSLLRACLLFSLLLRIYLLFVFFVFFLCPFAAAVSLAQSAETSISPFILLQSPYSFLFFVCDEAAAAQPVHPQGAKKGES